MKPSLWSLKHPVPVAIITAGAVLFGLLALFSLNREFIPPMTEPSISVVTLWPAAAAREVERDLTSVLEKEFSSLPAIEDIRSESLEGVSVIRIQFSEDYDIETAAENVRARVDTVAEDLPDNIHSRPKVSTWGSLDLPVLTFAVSGPFDTDELAEYVEDTVLPEVYKIDGTARASVLGDRRKVMEIRLDPEALAAAGSTPSDILRALQTRDFSLPAGFTKWNGREWSFRVSGEIQSIAELKSLPVGRAGSKILRLANTASIQEVFSSDDERMRSDGRDIAVVQITRRESGSAIKMSRDLKKRLKRLETGGVDFHMLHDDEQIVRTALVNVMQSALGGLAMAVIVIWIFLRNWRYTAVIAVSLPVSLVIAFAGMRLAGQSVNILTMAGLTVSLGMVVDASIVVLENIHRRRSAGQDAESAAADGSVRVSGAVLASITTTICVFLPMLFLGGLVGHILKDLSLTLVFALGASLFSALMIVPLLAKRTLQRMPISGPEKPKSNIMNKLERHYGRSLGGALKISGTVFGAAAVVLLISFLAADLLGISFIPTANYDEIFVSLKLPPGSSMEDSVEAADTADSVIRREIPELSDLVFYVGMEDDLAGDAKDREAVWAQLLLDGESGRRDFRSIIDQLNYLLPPALPGTEVTVVNGGFDRILSMSTDGSGYRVELSSESLDSLRSASAQVESILLGYPGVVSTQRDHRDDRRFITARLDPDALADKGINAADAALAVRIAFDGADAGDFRPAEGTDRTLRLTTDLKDSPPDSGAFNRLQVRGFGSSLVPLDSVASVQSEAGYSGIRRRDGKRIVTVAAFTETESVREIGRHLESALRENPLPAGVEWQVQGVGGLIIDSIKKLGIILGVALFLVYAVMAIQFERWLQPLIIMASVPFSFIGAAAGLAIFGSNLSLVSFLALVALGGIVVNNAIVQVDKINQLRREGMGLDEAVIQGSVSRLRPILMTTLTTFFGVIPLSFAAGTGAGIYAPLGQAIAGGLLTSTLVTLYLVPVLYRWTEGRREKRKVAVRSRERVVA